MPDKDAFFLRSVAVTVLPATGSGRTFENLRIAFDIEKTSEGTPNQGKIKIFNLNESSRALFVKGSKVILEAGYINNRGVIFQGDITNPEHVIEGPDIITTLTCGDGDNAFRNARIERAFPPNSKLPTIIQALADEMGFPLASVKDIPETIYSRGLTLSGLVRDQLDQICRKEKLDWSIQDETLQIIAVDKPTDEASLLISPASGLKGSPTKTDNGVKFKAFCMSRLRPGRSVKLESRFMNGVVKILKVQHTGDSRQGDFDSNCECSKLQ